MMLWDPLRYLEACPSSDGAAAMVLASEDARVASRTPAGVGPRDGHALRADHVRRARPGQPPGRPGLLRRRLRPGRGHRPPQQFDVAEVYVPFSWYEPMWLENLGFCALGDGWKLTESGATAFDGDIPWNPSGGVLSSNPIGASGMLRFLEVAMQVRGQAGEHQVDGAKRRPGPGLRRRVPVLLHVGGGERQALARGPGAGPRPHRAGCRRTATRSRDVPVPADGRLGRPGSPEGGVEEVHHHLLDGVEGRAGLEVGALVALAQHREVVLGRGACRRAGRCSRAG